MRFISILEKPNNSYVFLLTGSSARKVKKKSANFLGERAGRLELFPLTSQELSADFSLENALLYGTMPRVVQSLDPQQELYDYVDNYIKEEIQLEAAVRNLPPFHRFLKAAALSNSQIINYSGFARDVGVSVPTVKEYFSILEDTLMGFNVEPWKESKKRKSIETHRFYFFDLGVTHVLSETQYLDRNSDLYGRAFEHLIALELRAYLSYSKSRKKLCFWRTKQKDEVDFIIGDDIAIEVKASQKVQNSQLQGLKKLCEEQIISKYYLVTQDELNQISGDIHCLHWKEFLRRLWRSEIV